MYQTHSHPLTVMTSFPSNALSSHSDVKSPPLLPPSSSSYYFSTPSSNTTTLGYSITPPMGWNGTGAFGSLMPSPEETYSTSPSIPIMTSSAYHSPSSSNVSFEEDDMPIFFSPTNTTAAHSSPLEFSSPTSSVASFYPLETSFLTSPPPPPSSTHYITKPIHDPYHYQHHHLCHPKQQHPDHHHHHHHQQHHYSHQQQPVPLARPYACPTCPRAFARKHDLQRHIRVHTGAKPYLCMACKKPFARTDALKRHLRIEDACRLSPEIQALKGAGKRRYRNL